MHKIRSASTLAVLLILTTACGPTTPDSAPAASSSPAAPVSPASTATPAPSAPTPSTRTVWAQPTAPSTTDVAPTTAPGAASGSPTASLSLDGATFTSAGFGPLKIGRPASDYPGLINADATHDDDVDGPGMPDGLHALIGSTGTVTAIWTESSRFSSRKGARVGMPVTELRRIYPGSALEHAVIGTQSPEQALALKDSSDHGLYFLVDWDTRSTVTAIYAAAVSKDGHIDHRAT